MKKSLFIIVISLLGFSSITEAQIIVNSTQASTIKIKNKSSRQKGLILRPEGGVGFRMGHGAPFYCDFRTNIGYQFNPYITLGGGLGIDFMEEGSSTIPLYIDAKGYFSNRVWSPYYNVKLGYSANLTQPTPQGESYYLDYLAEGIYYAFGFGMNYKNFDFGIEISAMNVIENDKYGDHYDYQETLLHAIKLTFGYNFQLGKKK
jgi:hypothetical protein